MKLLKRLKNLWELSKLDPKGYEIKTEYDQQEIISGKPRMAQIVRRKDPIKEVLKNDTTIQN